jgi:hypothetical protein
MGESSMMERMYEIKNMKYESVYSPEVVERMKELSEIDYPIDDCLDFIDKYGEEEFLEYYDLLVDFEHDFRNVETQVLIDYYSGFSFLDLEYYGEFPSEKAFIEMYYPELDGLPAVLIIDWESTIRYVQELFDFVPSGKNAFHIFGK